MNEHRHQAREAALQVLYFWEVGHAAPQAALEAFFAEHLPEADPSVREFAAAMVLGTVAEVADLDRVISRHSAHWRIERLAVIDRLILRQALWELRHRPDTPAAVVLNEAIELARRFSGEHAVRFVNGVLDAVRAELASAPE